MAKKDKIKNEKNAVAVEENTKLIEESPYSDKTFDELLVLLEKKDELLGNYTTEISKLRKQVEECGEKYDEANQKSLEVIEKYNKLEAEFKSYKNELDAEFEEKVADLKSTHKEELSGQMAADKLKFDKAEEEYKSEIASIKEACEEQIKNLASQNIESLDKQKSALEKDFQKKLDSIEKKHVSEVNALKAEVKKLEALSTEGVFSEKLRKRFLDASKKAINETFDRLADEAEAEVSDKRKVEEAVNKANNRLKWLKEQQDHNAAETEELMSLLKELTGDVEA